MQITGDRSEEIRIIKPKVHKEAKIDWQERQAFEGEVVWSEFKGQVRKEEKYWTAQKSNKLERFTEIGQILMCSRLIEPGARRFLTVVLAKIPKEAQRINWMNGFLT